MVGAAFFFSDQARHLEYLLYIVLGAGLSRGWRDCSFYGCIFLIFFASHLEETGLCICAEWLLLLSTNCKKKKAFPFAQRVTPFVPAILSIF